MNSYRSIPIAVNIWILRTVCINRYIQIFQIEISLLWKEAKVLESNISPFCLIKEFLVGEEVSENEEVNDFQIIILVRSITLSRRRN